VVYQKNEGHINHLYLFAGVVISNAVGAFWGDKWLSCAKNLDINFNFACASKQVDIWYLWQGIFHGNSGIFHCSQLSVVVYQYRKTSFVRSLYIQYSALQCHLIRFKTPQIGFSPKFYLPGNQSIMRILRFFVA
jgi:hypothetical protein